MFKDFLVKRNSRKIAVVGGGAAGFFAAINIAEKNPSDRVFIFEKTGKTLQKVKISGGGRCNVTHACFSPSILIKNYPRGGKELASLFRRFQPLDTIQWFEKKGVRLKTEPDNRMFPVTDKSQTIVDCLSTAASRVGVVLKLHHEPAAFEPLGEKWKIVFQNGESQVFDAVTIAAGGAKSMWDILEALGHRIIPPVPSLFTFKISDDRLKGLQGISFPHVKCRMTGTKLEAEGPALITHWGLSGPAILKLSSFGARELSQKDYRFDLSINFAPRLNFDSARAELELIRQTHPKQFIKNNPALSLPGRYWQNLLAYCGFREDLQWREAGNKQFNKLSEEAVNATFRVSGKSTFKEEFVTCGGVDLTQVDLQKMESRLFPGLFFAGEILNVDAVTGGFNFQAAWTTAWIAAQAV